MNKRNYINTSRYWDRTFDENGKVKHPEYKKVLFKARDVLQYSELNELQDMAHIENIKLANSFLLNGEILSGGLVYYDPVNKKMLCSNMVIYLNEYFLDLDKIELPYDHSVTPNDELGVLTEFRIISHNNDIELYDKTTGFPNSGLRGAGRISYHGKWELLSNVNPNDLGNFVSIYKITNGGIEPINNDERYIKTGKDTVSKYDRNSHGNYIVDGLQVDFLDYDGIKYRFNVTDGQANIRGNEVVKRLSTVISSDALGGFLTKTKTVTPTDNSLIEVPSDTIEIISITGKTIQRTVAVSKNKTVLTEISDTEGEILNISYNNKLLVRDTDYEVVDKYKFKWKATSSDVPAKGETVIVEYKVSKRLGVGYFDYPVFNNTITGVEMNLGSIFRPRDYLETFADNKTYVVYDCDRLHSYNTGAPSVFVRPFEEVTIEYKTSKPVRRIDLITIDDTGTINIFKGYETDKMLPSKNIYISNDSNHTELATIYYETNKVPEISDSRTKALKKSDIRAMEISVKNSKYNIMLLADVDNVLGNHPINHFKNMFVDRFSDNYYRDSGLDQTAQCIGRLVNGISWKTVDVSLTNKEFFHTLDKKNPVNEVSQLLATKTIQINQYDYFNPKVADLQLNPKEYNWVSNELYQEFYRDEQLADEQLTKYRNNRIFSGFSSSNSSYVTKETTTPNTVRDETSVVTKQLSNFDTKLPLPENVSVNLTTNARVFNNNENVKISVNDKLVSTKPASNTGKLSTDITIPSNIISGNILISAIGEVSGAIAESIFIARPLITTKVITRKWQRTVTRELSINYDPIAQSFLVNQSCRVDSVGLYLSQFPSTFLEVQIVETQAGFPTTRVLASTKIEARDLASITSNYDGVSPKYDNETLVKFDYCEELHPNIDYAIVVKCNDTDGRARICKLGDRDNDAGKWVYEKPYRPGAFYVSSNASTWTPIQDILLKFKLNVCQYKNKREILLGKTTVTKMTDLMLLTEYEEGKNTTVLYYLQYTDKEGNLLKRLISPNSHEGMDDEVNGEIKIFAELKSGNIFSTPLVGSSIQLAVGTMEKKSIYSTRAIELPDNNNNYKLVIYVDMAIPYDSSIKLYYDDCSLDNDRNFVEITSDKLISRKELGYDTVEYNYEVDLTNVKPKLPHNVKETRLKIELLNNNVKQRPSVFNLRVAVEPK